MNSDTTLRERFVAGKIDKVRLGGYGGTVSLMADGARIRLATTRPKPRERVYDDNPAMRGIVYDLAERVLAAVGGTRRAPTIPLAPRGEGPGGLTPRMVWLAYLSSRHAGLPEDVFCWGRPQVAGYLAALKTNALHQAMAADSINAVLNAAKRLHRDGVVPLDSDFNVISRGRLEHWMSNQIAAGASPHTVKTYIRRFQTAVSYYQKSWPDEWGGRRNPAVSLRRVKTSHIKPPEITHDEAKSILDTLSARGEWRAVAAAIIAHETAHRIGSIAASRTGLHLKGAPLCAKDFRPTPDGGMEVTWRAEVQKVDGGEQGDIVQRATPGLVRVVEWLLAHHPNPAGPDHPLIWAERDPRAGESYDRLSRAFDAAWKAAFGAKRPRYLLWHSFSRGTITTIADELGLLAAAEFSGRSVETVARIYKRKRQVTQAHTAEILHRIRGGLLDPSFPTGE